MAFVYCWTALVIEKGFLPISAHMPHFTIAHVLESFRYAEITVQLRF